MAAILIGFLANACGSDQSKKTADQDTPLPDHAISVYTHRNYESDQQIFRLFEQRSGIKVVVQYESSAALVARLLAEGSQSKASLVLLDDVSHVLQLKQAGALKQSDYSKLLLTLPSRYCDEENYWIGLCKWAPAVVYAHERINAQYIQRYSDLADERLKGKLLLSHAARGINKTLLSAMALAEGEDKTLAWAEALVGNLHTAPLPDDYAIINALAEGKGDVGIINAASLILYQRSGNPEAFRKAEKLSLHYPTDAGGSTYYNLSVAAIPAHAPKEDVAMQLLSFLSNQGVQQTYAETAYEYPANPYALPNDFLIEIGGFKEKSANYTQLATKLSAAETIFKRSNWK